MLIATTAGGLLMTGVHKVVSGRGMPPEEYSIFLALLQVLNQMAILASGLQMTFAQQTGAASTEQRQRELAGAFRALMGATFVIWLLGAVPVFLFQGRIVIDYKLSNPIALWVTMCLGLGCLWSRIVFGVMQGQQNFLWLGWASILEGATRLSSIAVFVLLLGGYATGAMSGALAGIAVSLLMGLWQCRWLWRLTPERFLWKPWLKRVMPITVGYGAVTFMLTLDMIVVQRYFPKGSETAYYGAAATIGRAVFFFLAPLTTVMFPKIARSAALSEKTNILMQALGVTALMGVGAALACTLFTELPFRIMFSSPEYLQAAPLLPLFAWCMLPLPLATVLINNFLARQRFAVVPWLAVIAAGYYFTLRHVAQLQPQRFENIIWTLGAFSLLLLVVCLAFTWRERHGSA